MTPEQRAGLVVSVVRQQNWKNGGVLLLDNDEAESLVAAAIRAAEDAAAERMREKAAEWHLTHAQDMERVVRAAKHDRAYRLTCQCVANTHRLAVNAIRALPLREGK